MCSSNQDNLTKNIFHSRLIVEGGRIEFDGIRLNAVLEAYVHSDFAKVPSYIVLENLLNKNQK